MLQPEMEQGHPRLKMGLDFKLFGPPRGPNNNYQTVPLSVQVDLRPLRGCGRRGGGRMAAAKLGASKEISEMS